jgi:tetratricopeptide (TPR) repeat protein
MGLLQLYLETAQREPLEALLDDFDAAPLAEEGQGLWLFATLMTGRSAAALEHRAWLDEHPTFDVWLGFALAALETGDRARAVEWLRKAAAQPPATAWPIDGMHAWAQRKGGRDAEATRRFEAALSAAQLAIDDEGIARAVLDFADALTAER